VPMDPFELISEPEVLSTAEPLPTKLNLGVERTRHTMEQCWRAQQNNSHNEDEDEDNEDENNILDLSTWDLLRADFKHEAAALGLS